MKIRLNIVNLNNINQFLLAFYLGYLSLSRFIFFILPIKPFYILFVPAAITLAVSMALNYKKGIVQKSPLISLVMALLLLMGSMLFYWNTEILSYSYSFIIFGAIPLLLLLRIEIIDNFFKYFAYFGLATLVLLGMDPFQGYRLSTDYMVYGYTVMLPAYTGMYIARKYYKMKWLLPFEVLSLLLIIIFSNQGAFVSAAMLILLTNIFVDKVNIKKITIFIFALIVIILGVINLKPILEWGIAASNDNSSASYSLSKTYNSLYEGSDSLSGRTYYWSEALVVFKDKPFLGSGIGFFQSRYNIYTHNIILETAVSFGLLGIFGLIIYSLYYCVSLIKTSRDLRLLFILGISIGLVPLLFSLQPFIWCYFWVFTLNPWVNLRPIKLKELQNA
jgi:O-antigen ligase